ncbi:MAG: tetratricopeptide repeat protein, partial [Nitrospinales bacterium]
MRFIKSVGVLLLLLLLALFPLSSALAAEEGLDSISKGLEDFKSGRYGDARKVFEEIVQADPSNADAYYYLGLSLSKLERYSPATAAFEKALELNPQLTDVHLSLGIAYYKIKSLDQAEQALRRGVEADPRNSAAQFFLGLVYQSKGQDQKSIQHFSKAGELDRDFRQLALYNVGQAYFNMGRNEDARGSFQQAIDVDPQSDMGRESQKFLTVLERQEKAARRWKAQANAAWEFDDNVTRVEQDAISNVGDFSVNLGFQGEYKIVSNPKYEISAGYDVFQSIFQDLTEFNFQSHGLSLSGTHDADNWDAGVDYSYTYN